RGSLFHAVQFRLLSRLKEISLLPVSDANQSQVVDIADEVLDEVEQIYREDLKPAILRVWEIEVEELRWDLRGWIRQMALAHDSGRWTPVFFELAFGLPARADQDARSSPVPAELSEGVKLRGAIDMIEENGGHVRITDHKTGKAPFEIPQFVGRGEILQ